MVPPAPPLSVMNTSERYLPLKSSWFQEDCCRSLYDTKMRMFGSTSHSAQTISDPIEVIWEVIQEKIDDNLLEVIHVDDGQL